MASSMTFTLGVGGAQSVSKTITKTADSIISQSFQVADAATDYEVDIDFVIAELVGIYVVSDQNVTAQFNNSTTGVPDLSLIANEPYLWFTGMLWTNLFTADVTTCYWTNASGSAANINIEALVNNAA